MVLSVVGGCKKRRRTDARRWRAVERVFLFVFFREKGEDGRLARRRRRLSGRSLGGQLVQMARSCGAADEPITHRTHALLHHNIEREQSSGSGSRLVDTARGKTKPRHSKDLSAVAAPPPPPPPPDPKQQQPPPPPPPQLTTMAKLALIVVAALAVAAAAGEWIDEKSPRRSCRRRRRFSVSKKNDDAPPPSGEKKTTNNPQRRASCSTAPSTPSAPRPTPPRTRPSSTPSPASSPGAGPPRPTARAG